MGKTVLNFILVYASEDQMLVSKTLKLLGLYSCFTKYSLPDSGENWIKQR